VLAIEVEITCNNSAGGLNYTQIEMTDMKESVQNVIEKKETISQ
jgi:hypothetical protein